MSDRLNDFLGREFKQCHCIKIPNFFIGRVDPVYVWRKWLAYTPQFQLDGRDCLKCKVAAGLTPDEKKFLDTMKKNDGLFKLFEKFCSYRNQCSDCEISVVIRCVERFDELEKLMIGKLTLDELKEAKKKISEFDLDPKYCEDMADTMRSYDTYAQLSMVDSFVAYYALKRSYESSLDTLQTAIEVQLRIGPFNYL